MPKSLKVQIVVDVPDNNGTRLREARAREACEKAMAAAAEVLNEELGEERVGAISGRWAYAVEQCAGKAQQLTPAKVGPSGAVPAVPTQDSPASCPGDFFEM